MEKTKSDITELATRPIGRLLWEYSLPAIVGMVVMSLYNVIDRIFIGRGVGADEVALSYSARTVSEVVAAALCMNAHTSVRHVTRVTAVCTRRVYMPIG